MTSFGAARADVAGDTRARRLLISAAELWLLGRTDHGESGPIGRDPEGRVALPGFDVRPVTATGDAEADVRAVRAELLAARSSLLRRGLLHPSPDRSAYVLHRRLRVSLGALAAPEVLFLLHAHVGSVEVKASVAVRGPLGVVLARTGEVSLELSAFASADVLIELARLVPPAGGEAHDRTPVTVPLDELARAGAGLASCVPAQRLADGYDGALTVTVVGPPKAEAAAGDRSGADPGFLRGMGVPVLWVATSTGWRGLRPGRSHAGRWLVDLLPVSPRDLGAWLAPCVADALG